MAKLNHTLRLRAPHPSISASISRPKPSRPPVVNPYDKLTQPEFDVWIGDMTNALRHALGYEQVDQSRSIEQVNGSINGHPFDRHSLDDSDRDEEIDDSFALIKSRRAKGKARDPREGPGLGKGDRAQPIEILSSDSDEEEVVKDLIFREDEESSSSEEVYDDDEDEAEEEEEEDDDENEDETEGEDDDEDSDFLWKYGESSSQPLSSLPIKFGPPKLARKRLVASVSDKAEEVEEERSGQVYVEEFESEEEYEEGRGARALPMGRRHSEVVDIESESGSEEEDEAESRRYFVTTSTPSQGLPLYEEYASDIEEIEEIQPSTENTGFPPRQTLDLAQPTEICDPWEAPRRYAEDLYTGGDLSASARIHDIDHIGPMDDEYVEVGVSHNGRDEPIANQNNFAPLKSSPSQDDLASEGGSRLADPSPFDANEDEDSGIDSFLTPGVITPNDSEMHSRLDEHSDLDRLATASFDTIPENISALPSRPQRGSPPFDAEIISIDDSDTEISEKDVASMEDNLEVIPPSSYIEEAHEEVGLAREGHAVESGKPAFTSIPDDEVMTDRDDICGTSNPEEFPKYDGMEVPLMSESKDSNHGEKPIMEQASGVEFQEGEHSVKARILSGGLEEFWRAPTPPWDMSHPAPSAELLDNNSFMVAFKSHQLSIEVDDRVNNSDGDGGFEMGTGHFSPDLDHEGRDSIFTESSDNVASQMMASTSDARPEGGDGPLAYVGEEPVVEESLTEQKDGINSDVEKIPTPDSLADATFNIRELGKQEIPMQHVVEPEEKREQSPNGDVSPLKELRVFPGQRQIPMPVMADANVPDPTESPAHRLETNQVRSVPDSPIFPLGQDNASSELHSGLRERLAHPVEDLDYPFFHSRIQKDGLFTPAEASITTTPAEPSTALNQDETKNDILVGSVTIDRADLVQSEDKSPSDADSLAAAEIQHTVSSLDNESTSLDIFESTTTNTELTPLSLPVPQQLPPVSLHVPLSRKSSDPVLMGDPYPYSLSTPCASQIPHGEPSDDKAMDNSMSSKSTTEKLNEVGKADDLLNGGVLELSQRPRLDLSHREGSFVSQSHLPSLNPSNSTLTSETDKDDGKLGVIVSLNGTMDIGEHSQDPCTDDRSVALVVMTDDAVSRQDIVSRTSELSSTSPEKPADVSASRNTKRKREGSPASTEMEGPASGNKRRKDKEKVVDQPIFQFPEPDTIYVWPKQVTREQNLPKQLAQSSAALTVQTSEAASSPGDRFAKFSAPVVTPSKLPQLQFRPSALFHAHGRKRQDIHTHFRPVTRHIPSNESPSRCKPPAQRTLEQHKLPAKSSTADTKDELAILSGPSSITPAREPPLMAAGSSSQPVAGKPVPGQPEVETQSRLPLIDGKPPSPPPPDGPAPQSSTTPLHSPVRATRMPDPSTNTRSMRSRCIYHRISLPKEDDDSRAYFLVPGCSLSNHELMKKEQIEDHGGATYEDTLRMVRDIENLQLDQYVIGVMRQLVGLDIIREGEVFYLPQLGEDMPRKQRSRKSISERSAVVRVSAGGGHGSSYASSPGSVSSPTRPPHSIADSTSTSLSALRRAIDSENDSSIADSDPEVNDEGSRVANDRLQVGASTSSAAKQKRKRGRPRKVTAKEALYQPDEQEDSEESSWRKSTRLIKRTRTMEVGAGEGERKSKRLKMQLTAPL